MKRVQVESYSFYVLEIVNQTRERKLPWKEIVETQRLIAAYQWLAPEVLGNVGLPGREQNQRRDVDG